MLVPYDGSEDADRALTFGLEFCARYDADLHVVHVSDAETPATDLILDQAEALLAETDIQSEPELVIAGNIDIRTADRVGEEIIDLVAERDYDHVIMGHESADFVTEAIVGSAAKTVVANTSVPVTVVSESLGLVGA